MKGVLVIVLFFAVKSVFAQNFEGSIKWSIKAEVKDPVVRAELEKRAKGPYGGEMDMAIKMIEEKMKDPEVANNPAVKEQMEQQLSMLKGIKESQGNNTGGGMESFAPTSMVVKIKNGNSLTIMDGPIANMLGELLKLKGKEEVYAIKRNQKTYSILPQNNKNNDKVQENYKVVKTADKAKILNYNCTKYIVTTKDARGKEVKQEIWATTEFKDIDYKSFAELGKNSGQSFFYKEIEGFPLRVSSNSDGNSIVMEATEIKKQSLPEEEFLIPSDYKQTKFFGR